MKERQKYGGCAFSHMQHMGAHAHAHEDAHEHNGGPAKSKSSCGYMPVEEIKRLSEERKQETMTVAQKNTKKIAAVYAAKEDGNRLFKEKNYELAYKVYERGVLIINGMYQMQEAQEDEMERVECLLDLNMALVSLKLENCAEAINCCKMALQIDDKSAKAHFRWSEALIAMSEYDDARAQAKKAKQLEPSNAAIDKQLRRIDQLQKVQLDKAKKEDHRMAERFKSSLRKKQLT